MKEFRYIHIVDNNYISCSADGSGSQRWGEPAERPDGKTLSISIGDVDGNVSVCVDGTYAVYSRRQVFEIGDGEFESGLVRLGQVSYRAPKEQWIGGIRKLSVEKIKMHATEV